jgi:hypothetical protein
VSLLKREKRPRGPRLLKAWLFQTEDSTCTVVAPTRSEARAVFKATYGPINSFVTIEEETW